MTISLSQSLGGGSPVTWALDWLDRAKLPITAENIQVAYSWEYSESGGGGGMWNPFNTTEPWPGATDFNSVGVKNYASRDDGLDALATVIHQRYYTNVVAHFMAGNDARATADAITASPWGTGYIVLRPVPGGGSIPPPQPHPNGDTVNLVGSPHKPTDPTRIAAAVWDPAHPNYVTLTNGASIAGDTPGAINRVWAPPVTVNHVGIGIALLPAGGGIFLQDSAGATFIGKWS